MAGKSIHVEIFIIPEVCSLHCIMNMYMYTVSHVYFSSGYFFAWENFFGNSKHLSRGSAPPPPLTESSLQNYYPEIEVGEFWQPISRHTNFCVNQITPPLDHV